MLRVLLVAVGLLLGLLAPSSPAASYGIHTFFQLPEAIDGHMFSYEVFLRIANAPLPLPGPPKRWIPFLHLPRKGEVCSNVPTIEPQTGRIGKLCEELAPFE